MKSVYTSIKIGLRLVVLLCLTFYHEFSLYCTEFMRVLRKQSLKREASDHNASAVVKPSNRKPEGWQLCWHRYKYRYRIQGSLLQIWHKWGSSWEWRWERMRTCLKMEVLKVSECVILMIKEYKGRHFSVAMKWMVIDILVV